MSYDPLFDDVKFTLTPPDLPTVDDLRLFNSKALVSTLDDDILSRIFMFNASLDFERTHRPSQTTRRTSQVFHKWRQVALGFPMIWAASLDFGDPLPWIEEVISRTGSAPLNVVVSSITIPNPESLWCGDAENGSLLNMLDDVSEGIDIADDIFNLALPLINRARILAIKTDKSQWESLAPALMQPHPNLQSFSLLSEVYHTSFEDLALPENLFAGPAPQLRTFHLLGFICQPEYLSFQNLTSLSVACTFAGMPSHAPWDLTAVAWLRALEGMPKLKNLDLVYCVWETTGETLAPLPTEEVSLPQLQFVKLLRNLAACSVILAYLKVPSDCSIEIRCFDVIVNDHFRLMVSAFDRMLRSVASVGAVSREELISLSINSTELSLYNTYHHQPEKGRFFILWSAQNTMDFTDILLPFVSLLRIVGPDTNNVTLTFTDLQPPTVTGCLFVDILLSFPKVETLRMTITHTFHYLLPLLSARINNPEIGDQVVLLPRLTQIALFHLPFDADPTGSSNQLFIVEDLLKLLRQRAEMGVPIGTVKFKNCKRGPGFEEGLGKMEQLGVLVDLEERHRWPEDHFVDGVISYLP
ncbi:hypothetical protein BDZ97DRAFT_1762926 [Flammula alnicola]|nr:hypothetical protein BDZ97DRAFT_1762926 [Flammula alnicola]